ncbi:hypothetical protein WJX73_002908 [Symbiochloris irregularis]|uniref:Major facilitator superfamily (MFS) profile domain-containing protein n=1 Tax=Symbiochloris irregularis TaxID=706552 RepID=A0AAW1PVY0_9CHLO
MTEYGALQLFGGLFCGPLIDQFGPRLFIGIAMCALAIQCALTGLADRIWVVYLSRLPAILELAALSTRALIAERTSDQDRVRMLGYMGACSGAAIAVGPSIGGWLTAISYRLCAWSAALCALLSIAAVPLIGAGPTEDFAELRPAEDASRVGSAFLPDPATLEVAGTAPAGEAAAHLDHLLSSRRSLPPGHQGTNHPARQHAADHPVPAAQGALQAQSTGKWICAFMGGMLICGSTEYHCWSHFLNIFLSTR